MFTYLWNPLGGISLKYDESTHIGRAMHVLIDKTPQESTFYDHPYFGQLFLGFSLWITGYPNLLHPSAVGDVVNSVKMLWIVPRLLIGIIGVIDTFLVYKISERRYNTEIAFIAAILFAVMPVMFLRTIFLESLLLPFLLSSILFAIYSNDTIGSSARLNKCMVLLSGIFLGLTIFTKIPVFTMIPLVGFLIYSNNKSLKILGLWFIPVILIPLIWPSYALLHGEWEYWWDAIYWQTHRQEGTDINMNDTLPNVIVKDFFQMPILIFLGLLGLAFAAVKKDYFLLLWAIPFLVFLYFIGLVRDFHLIPILPALCISTGRLIIDLLKKLNNRKAQNIISFSVISAIAIFGLINFMVQFIKVNNELRFAEVAFVLRYLEENKNEDITTISNRVYSWIPKYVFHLGGEYMIPEMGVEEEPQNKKVLMVADPPFRRILRSDDALGKHLMNIYNEHSKEKKSTVVTGENKIVTPQPWPSGLTLYPKIDLIDNRHVWIPNSNSKINISQSDNNLTIIVKTKNTDKINKYAFLQTQLKNLTETPLLLSLDYASKSPNGNTKYFVQIGDVNDKNRRYFKGNLRDTSGNLTNSLFILPSNIVDAPLEFQLGTITNSTGEHVLIVKRASIMDPVTR
jgi:hypothetical protein